MKTAIFWPPVLEGNSRKCFHSPHVQGLVYASWSNFDNKFKHVPLLQVLLVMDNEKVQSIPTVSGIIFIMISLKIMQSVVCNDVGFNLFQVKFSHVGTHD